ncbi:MAG: hypothetical protein R6V10_17215, partial [bacterium]
MKLSTTVKLVTAAAVFFLAATTARAQIYAEPPANLQEMGRPNVHMFLDDAGSMHQSYNDTFLNERTTRIDVATKVIAGYHDPVYTDGDRVHHPHYPWSYSDWVFLGDLVSEGIVDVLRVRLNDAGTGWEPSPSGESFIFYYENDPLLSGDTSYLDSLDNLPAYMRDYVEPG